MLFSACTCLVYSEQLIEESLNLPDKPDERCFMQPLKNGKWFSNAEHNLDAIRKLGAESTILSTDCGSTATPPWEESIRQHLQFMVDHNVSLEELRSMTKTTPARLLGFADALE